MTSVNAPPSCAITAWCTCGTRIATVGAISVVEAQLAPVGAGHEVT